MVNFELTGVPGKRIEELCEWLDDRIGQETVDDESFLKFITLAREELDPKERDVVMLLMGAGLIHDKMKAEGRISNDI